MEIRKPRCKFCGDIIEWRSKRAYNGDGTKHACGKGKVKVYTPDEIKALEKSRLKQ